jgi:hypothetical protein
MHNAINGQMQVLAGVKLAWCVQESVVVVQSHHECTTCFYHATDAMYNRGLSSCHLFLDVVSDPNRDDMGHVCLHSAAQKHLFDWVVIANFIPRSVPEIRAVISSGSTRACLSVRVSSPGPSKGDIIS